MSQLRPQLATPSTDATVVFLAASEELSRFPTEHASNEFIECLLTIAQYFYLSNQCLNGLKAATQAVGCAYSLNDKRLLRKARSTEGVMLVETGNLPGATQAYADAIRIARELADPWY